jgi:hypothetical protein
VETQSGKPAANKLNQARRRRLDYHRQTITNPTGKTPRIGYFPIMSAVKSEAPSILSTSLSLRARTGHD